MKIENTVPPSPEQWMAVIHGMRNPMNSWDKCDSGIADGRFVLGDADRALALRLVRAGNDHGKFLRMLPVIADINAPLYWMAELDTYKIGVVRNSCSFMHKGVSEPYSIDNFSVGDDRIYEVLREYEQKTYTLKYPYETDEFKTYIGENGRTYRVYRNGRVIREAFDYIDNYGTGRKRHYDESPATMWQVRNGYFNIRFSGRGAKTCLLHKLVAEMWCDKPGGATQVNHIDGDKGNNCAENLEWVTPSENMEKAYETGLMDNTQTLRSSYLRWKNSSIVVVPKERIKFKADCGAGLTYTQLGEKYGIDPKQASMSRYIMMNSDNEDLFQQCYLWETYIDYLNSLREEYITTKDENVFRELRCMMPQGYMQKSTFSMNYAVLRRIYFARKGHKLHEWLTFREWIETLPCSELIKAGGE